MLLISAIHTGYSSQHQKLHACNFSDCNGNFAVPITPVALNISPEKPALGRVLIRHCGTTLTTLVAPRDALARK